MENEKKEKKQREKIVDSVIGSLEEALNEDVEEINEVFGESGEKTESDDADVPPKKIHRFFITVAIFMIFFSVIGIVTTVNVVSEFTQSVADKSALKNELALFVYPVVINDPPAYDSVDSLQPSTIISCAIWKIILTGNTGSYTRDMGVMLIPAVDVELSARSIFGTGSIDHQTTSNFEMEFTYNEEENTYYIPDNPLVYSYSPVISEVTNVGELYTVTVEYMAPSPQTIVGIQYDNQPIKSMIYTISRTKERTTINSIRFAEIAD